MACRGFKTGGYTGFLRTGADKARIGALAHGKAQTIQQDGFACPGLPR